MRPFRPLRLVPLALLVAALAARAPVGAQERSDTATATAPAAPARDSSSARSVPSPGGAFVRALLLPGWGHAAIGAYTRGGFYVALEGATGYMLARTTLRKRSAEATRDLRESEARAALAREGVTNPDTIAARLDNDDVVTNARALVEARGQQFQDWMALGVFLVFLSGADAFVSAHLAHFPAPVTVEAAPVATPGGTGVELGLKVPVGPPLGVRLSPATP